MNNSINTLLLTCSHFNPTKDELRRLQCTYPQLKITVENQTSYSSKELEQAEIIVGFPKPNDLIKAKNLLWLQTPSAGIQEYADKNLFFNANIMLTNSRGTFGRQIGDHVIGMIIAFNHNFFTYQEQMKEKKWIRYFPTKNIWDSTVLIVGLGDIGTNIAKRAKTLGMYVIAIKRTISEKPEFVDELYTLEEIDSQIPKADYVVLSLASTPKTIKIFNKDRIALMKRDALFINVARGDLVDQTALITALQEKKIAGAGLDATSPEPLETTCELWNMENVFITPHASGLSSSDSSSVFEIFFHNVKNYIEKESLKNAISFQERY